MQAQSLISVLVPMYNVEKFISRCIKSIQNQTYKNLEIILLDDGSNDATFSIASEFAKKDERIKLIKKPNEHNISLTRNALLNEITGEYVAFVDSDDAVEPKYIEQLYLALTSTGADMSCCKYSTQNFYGKIFHKKRNKITVIEKEDIIENMVLKKQCRFCLWNKLFKTNLIKSLRFNKNVLHGEDLFFCIDYAKLCNKVAFINDRLYHYIQRAGSEMHQKFSQKQLSLLTELKLRCENETDEKTKKVLFAWLCFANCGYAFTSRKLKEYSAEREQMKQTAKRFKNYLLKNKSTRPLFKFIVRLGLLTWCK